MEKAGRLPGLFRLSIVPIRFLILRWWSEAEPSKEGSKDSIGNGALLRGRWRGTSG